MAGKTLFQVIDENLDRVVSTINFWNQDEPLGFTFWGSRHGGAAWGIGDCIICVQALGESRTRLFREDFNLREDSRQINATKEALEGWRRLLELFEEHHIETHDLSYGRTAQATLRGWSEGGNDQIPVYGTVGEAADVFFSRLELLQNMRAETQLPLPAQPAKNASREEWYRYKWECDRHPRIMFTHKELADALGLAEGTVRNYYAIWKAGIDDRSDSFHDMK